MFAVERSTSGRPPAMGTKPAKSPRQFEFRVWGLGVLGFRV